MNLPSPPHIFKTGDLVRITYEGEAIEGRVLLASANGVSLMLEFDGVLGSFAGMMPVLYVDNEFTELANKKPVYVKPRVLS